MKYIKEIKAALIGFLAIGLFMGLVKFIEGKNFFRNELTVYTVYKNVSGLQPSRPVIINGLKVGRIETIFFHPKRYGFLVVKMKINSDTIKFSKKSIARVVDANMVEAPQIEIEVSQKGPLVKEGDFIASMEGSLFKDTLKKGVPLSNQLENTLGHVNTTLKSINVIIDREGNRVTELLKNINLTLEEFNRSAKVAQLTMHGYRKFVDNINEGKIQSVLTSIERSSSSFQGIFKEIHQGQGTLGKLLKDKSLYDELIGLSKQVRLLSEDLRLHPKRYFHFSVFGKKELPYKTLPPLSPED